MTQLAWTGWAAGALGPRARREDPDPPGRNADAIDGWFSGGVAQSLAGRAPNVPSALLARRLPDTLSSHTHEPRRPLPHLGPVEGWLRRSLKG